MQDIGQTAPPTVIQTASPVSERTKWVDSARGIAVVLVVMGHYYVFMGQPAMAGSPADRFWSPFLGDLSLLRLPLLFLLSGMLLSKYIQAGWKHPKTRSRVRTTAYFYLVWVFIYAVVMRVLPDGSPYAFSSAEDALSQLWQPDTPLRFIFALTVYAAVFATLSVAPRWLILVLAISFGLWTATFTGHRGQNFWLNIMTDSMYFAAGVYAKPFFNWFASPRRWPLSTLLVIAGLLIPTLTAPLDVTYEFTSVSKQITSAILVCGALGIIAFVCQWRAFASVTTWFGRRTLPIYVLHLPVIWVLIVVHRKVPLDLFPLQWAWPVVGTALILVGCLASEWLLRRAHLGYLFAAPLWVRSPGDKLRQSAGEHVPRI